MIRILSRSFIKLCNFSSVKEPVGDVYTWADKTPTKVELPEKAKRVSLGQNHTCIVGESG